MEREQITSTTGTSTMENTEEVSLKAMEFTHGPMVALMKVISRMA
jgi:hypothetical protein